VATAKITFTTGEKIGAAFLLLPFAIGASVYRAWVATFLWAWFVVPLGAQQIGTLHACGLVILLGLVRWKPADTNPDGGPELILKMIFNSLFATTFTLGFAAVVHAWM
jgi:hypothetical protein